MRDEQKLYYEARRAGFMLVIIKDTANYWLGRWMGDSWKAEELNGTTFLTASEVRQIIKAG